MRRTIILLLSGVFALALASPALAATAEPSGRNLVVLSGDAYVPAGETVDTVVAFDGAVVIDGQVRYSVVAFHGPVTIAGSVGQNVALFDGRLRVTAGATVGGDVYADTRAIDPNATIGGAVSSMSRLAVGFGWASAVLGFLVWLSIALSVLVLGVLLLWFAPRAADSVAAVARGSLGPAIGWGLLVVFGLPALGLFATATVVGMPLGIGVLLALALLFAIGQTAGAWALGRRLLPTSSRARAFLLGWAIVSAIALVPFVGGVVWFAATVVGLGAMSVAVVRAGRASASQTVVPPIPV